jgi:hypothetical protein
MEVELVGEQQRLVLQQHEPQQPVRKRKATSKVWQHFKEIPDGAKCNYECVEVIPTKQGTDRISRQFYFTH